MLGSIESGVDFERRIVDIYQKCRTPEQIESEFNLLQQELEEQIDERIRETRRKLLENFDEEVQEKLRLGKLEAEETLNRYEQWLWQLTRYYLRDYATFEEGRLAFTLSRNPFPEEKIHPGPYRAGKNVEDANVYRVGHPLAQRIIERCKTLDTPDAELVFDYSGSHRNIAALDTLKGRSGWLSAVNLTVTTFETQDHVLLAGVTDEGDLLEPDQCQRLLTLDAEVRLLPDRTSPPVKLWEELDMRRQAILSALGEKNARYFEAELNKLDRWGEDQRNSLKVALKELDEQIKETQEGISNGKYGTWNAGDALINEVEKRLQQQVTESNLFTIRWYVR